MVLLFREMDSNPWSDDTKNIKPLELPELDSSAWRDDGQSNTRNKRDDTVIPTQGAGFQEISLNEMESAKSLSNPLNNSHKLMNIPLSNDKSASCSNLNTKSMELKEDGKHVRNYSQEDLEEKLHQG